MHQQEQRGKTERLVAVIVGLVATLFGLFGVWLTYLGAGSAKSTMTFFGQELSTTSVGLGCIFIAGVALVLVLRRVLRG